MPKIKHKSTKTLKKRAWNLISEFVRRSAADNNGIVKCYTCAKPHFWTDMDCGHYIHGDNLDLEINNLRAQCNYCNRRLHGNSGIFCEKLIKEIGSEEIERLRFKKNQVLKLSFTELKQIIEEYKQKLLTLTRKD